MTDEAHEEARETCMLTSGWEKAANNQFVQQSYELLSGIHLCVEGRTSWGWRWWTSWTTQYNWCEFPQEVATGTRSKIAIDILIPNFLWSWSNDIWTIVGVCTPSPPAARIRISSWTKELFCISLTSHVSKVTVRSWDAKLPVHGFRFLTLRFGRFGRTACKQKRKKQKKEKKCGQLTRDIKIPQWIKRHTFWQLKLSSQNKKRRAEIMLFSVP